jgi:AmiR/NasT family two-component response regulator
MGSQRELHVLIVEDDFMVGQMIRGRVENLGYIVAGEAQDGRQAVEMTQSLRPDVVLMDIEMPDMNGIEATRRIYESCPTPVVILTAYDTPELVEQASQVGAGAYLIKLPKTREIERAITIAMARFGDMIELRRLNAELQAHSQELEARNQELQAALDRVKLLSGLLPICANCKKIRDDAGYWQDVAVYIRDHSEVEFSHGICPECMEELYPKFMQGK